ncbi:endonuclease V [Aureivirga sp. CE67]|uniref:endonuclease V n=1 Tax=Aureivirga sp. CE67 TaxID=1788983 RepID=UPI0018C8F292|nr:endonuclease V [Aureivirga sp. CE67]
MIYAFDTYYFADNAKTVCVKFKDWNSEEPEMVFEEIIKTPENYESGAFYKRELPCLLSLLEKIDLEEDAIIIVDGYVTLNSTKDGLGGYLFHELNEKYPIVGVAKNNFSDEDSNKRAVLRGESKKPLYVTAKGIDVDFVKKQLENMHGEYRMPTLLKKLDQLTREDLS